MKKMTMKNHMGVERIDLLSLVDMVLLSRLVREQPVNALRIGLVPARK